MGGICLSMTTECPNSINCPNGLIFWIINKIPSVSSNFQKIGEIKSNECETIPQIKATSLAKALAIERIYDNPRISNKRSNKITGKNKIVIPGINENTGIKPKNTPIVMNASNPVAEVATIGKISLLILIDFIIPWLDVKNMKQHHSCY